MIFFELVIFFNKKGLFAQKDIFPPSMQFYNVISQDKNMLHLNLFWVIEVKTWE